MYRYYATYKGKVIKILVISTDYEGDYCQVLFSFDKNLTRQEIASGIEKHEDYIHKHVWIMELRDNILNMSHFPDFSYDYSTWFRDNILFTVVETLNLVESSMITAKEASDKAKSVRDLDFNHLRDKMLKEINTYISSSASCGNFVTIINREILEEDVSFGQNVSGSVMYHEIKEYLTKIGYLVEYEGRDIKISWPMS